MGLPVNFKFLSGEHIGATLALVPGSYLLGNTEDCDIELEKGQTAAVRLDIDENNGVTVSLEDGEAFVGNTALTSEKVKLNPGDILVMGLTAIALTAEGMDLKKIDLSALGFNTSQDTEQQESPADGVESSPELKTTEEISEEPEAALEFESPKYLSVLIAAGFAVLVVLFSGLILGSYLYGEKAHERDALAKALAYLEEKGASEVTVAIDDRLLIFEGTLASSEEYASFVADVPAFAVPSIFKISVKDRRLAAVEDAFIRRGGDASARYSEDGSEILVYGYVRDPYVEGKVITEIEKELKPDLQVISMLIYEQSLRSILENSASEYLLPLEFNYEDLYVVYDGRLNLEERRALKEFEFAVTQRVGGSVALISRQQQQNRNIGIQRVGVYADSASGGPESNISADLAGSTTYIAAAPVQIDPAAGGTGMAGGAGAAAGSSAGAQSGSSGGTGISILNPALSVPRFGSSRGPRAEPFQIENVTGVTMSPLRFISMRSGQKFFEGALMSDGSVLQQITLDKLVFLKDGEEVVYELK